MLKTCKTRFHNQPRPSTLGPEAKQKEAGKAEDFCPKFSDIGVQYQNVLEFVVRILEFYRNLNYIEINSEYMTAAIQQFIPQCTF